MNVLVANATCVMNCGRCTTDVVRGVLVQDGAARTYYRENDDVLKSNTKATNLFEEPRKP
jgi:hypothetical protein